jgi:hypothetical protein
MLTHVKILAVLNIVLGVLGILIGFFVLLLMGGLGAIAGLAGHSHDAILALPILGGIGVFIFGLIAIISIPGVIAGIGLLKFRPWSRILTIVLSAFHLLNVPFGTAIGIYGLWVLLSDEGQRLFLSQSPAKY